ncbi:MULTISPECIES: hypothetical protein [unclassified Microcoleus]|uniref:hypothetical protein n=1 Tax=unclassified Microcoleus TaxID=2642155 RepID=UPI002FD686C7
MRSRLRLFVYALGSKTPPFPFTKIHLHFEKLVKLIHSKSGLTLKLSMLSESPSLQLKYDRQLLSICPGTRGCPTWGREAFGRRVDARSELPLREAE